MFNLLLLIVFVIIFATLLELLLLDFVFSYTRMYILRMLWLYVLVGKNDMQGDNVFLHFLRENRCCMCVPVVLLGKNLTFHRHPQVTFKDYILDMMRKGLRQSVASLD